MKAFSFDALHSLPSSELEVFLNTAFSLSLSIFFFASIGLPRRRRRLLLLLGAGLHVLLCAIELPRPALVPPVHFRSVLR